MLVCICVYACMPARTCMHNLYDDAYVNPLGSKSLLQSQESQVKWGEFSPPRRGGGLKFLAPPSDLRILVVTPARGPNDPKGLQDCPKRLRREPQQARMAQDGPDATLDGPMTAAPQQATKIMLFFSFSKCFAFSPFRLSDAPRQTKRSPKSPKVGRIGSQDDAGGPDDSSKTAEEGPKTVQEDPRIAQKGPKTASREA